MIECTDTLILYVQEFYNSPERDKIAVVKQEIDQVKNVMFENIGMKKINMLMFW